MPGAVLPKGRHAVLLSSPCEATGVDVILGLIAATATALLLALIARDDVGMPPDMIREDALIAASVMIAALAGIASPERKE